LQNFSEPSFACRVIQARPDTDIRSSRTGFTWIENTLRESAS
jgi:hypothetical protein